MLVHNIGGDRSQDKNTETHYLVPPHGAEAWRAGHYSTPGVGRGQIVRAGYADT